MKKGLIFILFSVLLICSCGKKSGPTHDAIIETTFGPMKVMLYDETPKHKKNFLKLAGEGFYDELLFHRVIKGFMIQGGDPDSKNAPSGQKLGMGGPGYKVPAEIGFPHFRGCIAAARGNSPNKESSGSQFYIVHGKGPIPANQLPKNGYNDAQIQLYGEIGGTPQLDMNYTVFGEIIDGFDVLDKIANMPTDQSDRPMEDVKMHVRLK